MTAADAIGYRSLHKAWPGGVNKRPRCSRGRRLTRVCMHISPCPPFSITSSSSSLSYTLPFALKRRPGQAGAIIPDNSLTWLIYCQQSILWSCVCRSAQPLIGSSRFTSQAYYLCISHSDTLAIGAEDGGGGGEEGQWCMHAQMP